MSVCRISFAAGYGQTHPVTMFGKVLCVAYALFGIPLALMVLSGIGEKLSALSSKVHRLELNQDSPAANKYESSFDGAKLLRIKRG